jgi:hypothetical protein
MNKIPLKSQVSLLKGFWFIFQDGDREIAAHGSALTGHEQIFVNKQLISEKRSLSMTSRHQFTWEENIYEIVFHVPNILTGKMDCSLIKDDVLLECFKTSYKFKFRTAKILGSAVLGAVIGFLSAYFNLPFWPLLILCVFFIAFFAAKETRNIVIEKEMGRSSQ